MMLPFSYSPQQNSPASAEVQDVLNTENAGAFFRSAPAQTIRMWGNADIA
jgi:hypothetical protein